MVPISAGHGYLAMLSKTQNSSLTHTILLKVGLQGAKQSSLRVAGRQYLKQCLEINWFIHRSLGQISALVKKLR